MISKSENKIVIVILEREAAIILKSICYNSFNIVFTTCNLITKTFPKNLQFYKGAFFFNQKIGNFYQKVNFVKFSDPYNNMRCDVKCTVYLISIVVKYI